MRKTREIIRLNATTDLSARQIAQSCGVSPTSVGKTVRLVREAGLSWPLPDLSDSELSKRLHGRLGQPAAGRPLPDYAHIGCELARKGVTLRLLWEEYRRAYPEDGYGYSQFCERFRRWRQSGCQARDVPVKTIKDPRLHQMRAKLDTDAGRAIYGKRKQTVEPVFGVIKEAMGFRQFLLRGLEKVRGEWQLVCLAYNVKRLHGLIRA